MWRSEKQSDGQELEGLKGAQKHTCQYNLLEWCNFVDWAGVNDNNYHSSNANWLEIDELLTSISLERICCVITKFTMTSRPVTINWMPQGPHPAHQSLHSANKVATGLNNAMCIL